MKKVYFVLKNTCGEKKSSNFISSKFTVNRLLGCSKEFGGSAYQKELSENKITPGNKWIFIPPDELRVTVFCNNQNYSTYKGTDFDKNAKNPKSVENYLLCKWWSKEMSAINSDPWGSQVPPAICYVFGLGRGWSRKQTTTSFHTHEKGRQTFPHPARLSFDVKASG